MSGLCKECVSGVTHEGIPVGKVEKFGNIGVYVAIPPEDVEYAKDKAVLFLTDVFGVPLVNNRLLADDFARNGLQVYMPDYFEGDPAPGDAMNNPNFNWGEWLKRHSFEKATQIVEELITALQEKGVTRYGAVGYCYGAPPTMTLAHQNRIQAAVFTHPSGLSIPGDLEALLQKSNVPVLFNGCEVDSQYPIESQKIADGLLGDGKYKPGYEKTYWKGCVHGFAVRGDMSDSKVKEGKEGAFKATAEFFLNKL